MINNIFDFGNVQVEQDLYEEVIIESLQIYGHNIKYIPREIADIDQLLGEDRGSVFKDAYTVEMYVENLEAFEGQELFQKFGVNIQDEGTLVVSRRRWNEEIADHDEELIRPREGDLVWLDLSKSLFEITFVEHEEPFYQLNNLPVYKLRVSLFNYNSESLKVDGIDISHSMSEGSQVLVLDAPAAFLIGEKITQVIGSTSVTGIVTRLDGDEVYLAQVSSSSDRYTVFQPLNTVVGAESAITANVTAVRYNDARFGKNQVIQDEAADILDFDQSNPFGEY